MLSSIKCIIIYPNATMKDCNKFDTGMTEPKLENLWSNPFVFSSTIKYLKYKKMTYMLFLAFSAELEFATLAWFCRGSPYIFVFVYF